MERLKYKDFNKNFPFKTDIQNHIKYIKKELNNKSLEEFWEIQNSIFLNIYMDNTDDLTESFNKIIKKINGL